MARRLLSPQLGQFAGNTPLPQEAALAITEDFHDQLTGDPGLRLSGTTGRQVYRGGGLQLQAFVRPPGTPNSDEQLEMLPVSINTRRSLNRFRGMPPV